MNRSGHNPGRGSESSPLARKTPITVTAAQTSHVTTPTARTQGVEPAANKIAPTMATASPA